MGLFRRRRQESAAEPVGPAPAPEPTPADDVQAGMAAAAAQLVEFHAASRPPGAPRELDYSRASLAVVDELLGFFHERGEEPTEPVYQSVAAYIYEVARREFGGRYLSYDDDDPIVLVVGEPEFRAALRAMSKARGRVRLGDEDNIPFFYDGLVAAVSRRSSAVIV